MTVTMAHSVRARLLNISKARGEDFNLVLTRYGLERLLYRLSKSSHAKGFVLKGAMLFTLWSEHPHRPSKDLDLHGFGAPDLDRLATVFREVCDTEVEDDGLVFDQKAITADRIKEDAEYEGVRVIVAAKLGSARLMLQIDIGFGDAITPGPEDVDFPTLLDLPAPKLSAYPRATVVAEKLQAMVHLGLTNSRMKDFFDLWFLARTFDFDGPTLVEAVRATFERRRTPIPEEAPLALTETFTSNVSKQTQWMAFLKRSGVADRSLTLRSVVDAISLFLLPVLRGAQGSELLSVWTHGGPWGERG